MISRYFWRQVKSAYVNNALSSYIFIFCIGKEKDSKVNRTRLLG